MNMPLHSVDSLLSHLVLFKFHSVDVVKHLVKSNIGEERGALFGLKFHHCGTSMFSVLDIWDHHVHIQEQRDMRIHPCCLLAACLHVLS